MFQFDEWKRSRWLPLLYQKQHSKHGFWGLELWHLNLCSRLTQPRLQGKAQFWLHFQQVPHALYLCLRKARNLDFVFYSVLHWLESVSLIFQSYCNALYGNICGLDSSVYFYIITDLKLTNPRYKISSFACFFNHII